MNNLAFRISGRLGRRVLTLHTSSHVSHPVLSASELEKLAQRIATVDGVPIAQARRQIAQFRGAPFGPNVVATRRHTTSDRGESSRTATQDVRHAEIVGQSETPRQHYRLCPEAVATTT
jgi:hypothetical protein